MIPDVKYHIPDLQKPFFYFLTIDGHILDKRLLFWRWYKSNPHLIFQKRADYWENYPYCGKNFLNELNTVLIILFGVASSGMSFINRSYTNRTTAFLLRFALGG